MDAHDIDVAMANQQPGQRPVNSISASQWSDCDRALWLTLRRASSRWLEPQTLRTFNIGHALEECLVDWLETTGVKVGMREAALKNSYGTSLGHIDGIAVMPDGEFMLLEMKTANNRRFKDWLKTGVPDNYFAQVQLYMHHSAQLSSKGNQLTKALFLVVNKDTSELHTEVVNYERAWAGLQTERIEGLIATDAYPEPNRSYKCRFCDHRPVCEGEILPQIDCRTCAHVSVNDGVFTCPHSNDGCETPCERHIMHPQMMEEMGFTIVNVDSSVPLVEYEHFAMAAPGAQHPEKPVFNSYAMKQSLDDGVLSDPTYMAIAKAFDATPTDGPEWGDNEEPF